MYEYLPPVGTSPRSPQARYRGAWAFLHGEPFNANNIIVDKTAIYSYGYHFPMAYREQGALWVNEDRYSVTTSKHQSALRTVLGMAGYAPGSQTDSRQTPQGYTFRLWTRDSAA